MSPDDRAHELAIDAIERAFQNPVGTVLHEAIANVIAAAIREAEKTAAWRTQKKVIDAAYYPKPFCRECADNGGTCPHSGRKCDPFEAALDTLREHATAAIEAREAGG